MPRLKAEPDQMATRHYQPTHSYTNPGGGRNQYSHMRDLADGAVREGRVLSEAKIMSSYAEEAGIPQNFKEVQMACPDIMFGLQHMANPRGYTCEAALTFKAV